MKLILISLLVFIFNFLIFNKFKKLAFYFSFMDRPDHKLKNHDHPVSLSGGLILLMNLYLIIFVLKIFNLDNFIFNDRFIYPFFIMSTFFYLIGFIDDVKNLTPGLKLLLICVSSGVVFYFFPELKLVIIKISFLDKIYYFNSFALFFLIMCFALLSNALNMFDGINLQLILFSFFVFIVFILKGFFIFFYFLILISLIFLGLLNYKNKLFLGDGGSYLISSIIGLSFIYQYKYYENFLYADEIFIILLIPSLDMFRLFCVRLINKKNPFKGDLNHFHHIIKRYYKNNHYTLLISTLSFILPSILLIFQIKTYYILIISVIFYTLTIISLKKKI